jgi:hypothetical protein
MIIYILTHNTDEFTKKLLLFAFPLPSQHPAQRESRTVITGTSESRLMKLRTWED